MPADIVPTGTPDEVIRLVRWNEAGLAPVITQEAATGEVLMFAWADAQALHFDCRAADADALARVQLAIDSHIELFSRKNPLRVDWQPTEPLEN